MSRVLVIGDDIWFNGMKARDIIFNEDNIAITIELPSVRNNPTVGAFNLGSIQTMPFPDMVAKNDRKDVKAFLRSKEFRVRYNINSEDLVVYA